MRRAFAFAVVALSLAIGSTARAAESSPSNDGVASSGLRLGLRTGVAMPIGPIYQASGSISDSVAGYVPLRLDIGYRFGRRYYIGAAGQLATLLPNDCTSGTSCSGTDARAALVLAVHLFPSSRIDPWLGAGFGYESLTISRSTGGVSVDMNARGFELANLEVGVDWRITPSFRVGPVLSSSLSRFTKITVDGTPSTDFDPALHAWVMLGVRGAYDL